MNNQLLHRQLIVISGSLTDCTRIAKKFTTHIKPLWLSDTAIEGQQVLAMSKATTVLGQQFQAVVFNAHSDPNKNLAFDANAFGAITGTVVGGGYLLLLSPDLQQWGKQSYFLQRFIRLLKQFSLSFYNKNKRPMPAKKIALSPQVQNPVLSNEQQTVFNAMLRVMHGHRRRPLILTSDRGRGKSTLLGRLAAHLLQQNIHSIIVSAPSRAIANTLFDAARLVLTTSSNSEKLLQNLHFLSPDELHQQKPKADLILIDEAASIPLPMLKDFVKQHSRLIFSTTEHGYEGSGRGFAIRFRTLLDTLCPQWKSVRLEQPFRWSANDPLEKFSFDALLLNAKGSNLGQAQGKLSPSEYSARRVTQVELLKNESLLTEIFALLVSAHYQTRPSDLVRLLDDPAYHIFILFHKNKLIATAIIVEEGGFSQSLATEIYYGNRRPQGHLIPQLLATHVGIKNAPCYCGNRIMRIAVHPQLQRKGIGRYLLQYLIDYSKHNNKADYIATSFSATPELIAFWNMAQFKIVQIGMKRDASSGTHSIIMLHPLKNKAENFTAIARAHFKKSLPLLLADPLRHLEAPLVTILFKQSVATKLVLEKAEHYALYGFCEQQRGYESSIVAIYKLFLSYLYQPAQTVSLTSDELQILIAKVLQKRSWTSLVKLTNAKGKKQAIKLLRQAVKKLT